MIAYLMTWAALKADRRAVTALEYGLVAAGIVVILGGAMSVFGDHLKAAFESIIPATNGFANGTACAAGATC